MSNEYKRVQVPITEEIKHLRWRLMQTEERAVFAENRLSYLLDWITQGQMSGYNYTYEEMHQAVENAFMQAVEQQEERAERAERENKQLRNQAGERNYWWNRAGELAEALEHLRDIQNGPPLLKKEQEWKQLMERIDKLLKEAS